MADFPVTPGAFDSTQDGWRDGFVLKLVPHVQVGSLLPFCSCSIVRRDARLQRNPHAHPDPQANGQVRPAARRAARSPLPLRRERLRQPAGERVQVLRGALDLPDVGQAARRGLRDALPSAPRRSWLPGGGHCGGYYGMSTTGSQVRGAVCGASLARKKS